MDSLVSDTASADDVIAAAEQHAMVLGCMTTLNELQRAVVQLRLVDDIPGENVASQLGTNPNHVAVLLHRAKHHLRSCSGKVEAA
jgi:RNA polymerase sigma-70 factor (ECF subfamily)